MTVANTVFLLKESSDSLINTQLCKVSHYMAVMQITCKKKKEELSPGHIIYRDYHIARTICMAQSDALIEVLPAWGVHIDIQMQIFICRFQLALQTP